MSAEHQRLLDANRADRELAASILADKTREDEVEAKRARDEWEQRVRALETRVQGVCANGWRGGRGGTAHDQGVVEDGAGLPLAACAE